MKTRLFNTAALALLIAAAPLAAHADKIKTITAPATISMSKVEHAPMLASQWEDGKRQEMAGLALIEDARKQDKSARKDLRKAEEKHAKLAAKTDDRRARFVSVAGNIGLAETPGEGAGAMKLAAKALDGWKDEVESLGKASDKVRDAEAAIAAAASAMRNGEEQVISGREKMRRAELEASGVSIAEPQVQTKTREGADETIEFVEMN